MYMIFMIIRQPYVVSTSKYSKYTFVLLNNIFYVWLILQVYYSNVIVCI